ncbi:MAG TPA: hypothetical protein DCL60_00030 [Armatimonadetes bacterium]|nr:hypothetical protein [Armatimonadota bacterium]
MIDGLLLQGKTVMPYLRHIAFILHIWRMPKLAPFYFIRIALFSSAYGLRGRASRAFQRCY